MLGSAFKKNVYTFKHRNRRPNSTLKNECSILGDIVNHTEYGYSNSNHHSKKVTDYFFLIKKNPII